MRSWVPVPGTTSGRLVEAALDLFGELGYAAVGVEDLAGRAGVTTGALYHHFHSKAGLYELVRVDVERRVVDRLEGAAAAHPVSSMQDLSNVLLVAFDHVVSARQIGLLADPVDVAGGMRADPIEAAVDQLLGEQQAQIGYLVAAVWRSGLARAGDDPDSAGVVRQGMSELLGHGQSESQLSD